MKCVYCTCARVYIFFVWRTGYDDEILVSNLQRLRRGVEKLLVDMSRSVGAANSKYPTIFLINNYDCVLQHLQLKAIESEEVARFKELMGNQSNRSRNVLFLLI